MADLLPTKWLLTLTLIFTFSLGLQAQHIYVYSEGSGIGGWIVDSTAQTFFEIPEGWRIAKRNTYAARLTNWPVLFEHTVRRDSASFAFLHEDKRWEVLTDYDMVTDLGRGCFSLGNRRGRNTTFLFPGGTKEIENYIAGSLFNEQGLAIFRSVYLDGPRKHGLVDEKGEWVLPPAAGGLFGTGRGQFFAFNTSRQAFMLNVANIAGEWKVDTVRALNYSKWIGRPNWPYDETGHTWLSAGLNKYVVIDLNGKVVSDTLESRMQDVQPFEDGLSWIGRSPRLIDVSGQQITTPPIAKAAAVADGRILVQDSATLNFGYLATDGDWVIPPTYCHGTSFRDGLAVVDAVRTGACGRVLMPSENSLYQPPFVLRNGKWGYQQVLDTAGNVVLQDSCLQVFLLSQRIIVRTKGGWTRAPGFRINWLDSGQYWLSPDYHHVDWADAISDRPEEVRRIDLKARSVFDRVGDVELLLPADFAERLPSWQNLIKLDLSSHRINTAWPAILAVETLQHLTLQQCRLNELPAGIDRLTELRYLDISDNDLQKLPEALYRMEHLQELNVADNPLPPETIQRLQERLPNTKIIH